MTTPDFLATSKQVTLHSLNLRQTLSSYTPHRGLINCASINHNNKVIASCGQDGRIVLVTPDKIDVKKPLTQFWFGGEKERNASVSCCGFSMGSKFLAGGSVDSLVKVWDLKDNKKQTPVTLKPHIASITSLAWLRPKTPICQGEILASASSCGQIYLHGNSNGHFQKKMYYKTNDGINTIRINEEGGNNMAACTTGGQIMVWDLNKLNSEPFFEHANVNRAAMTGISFSPFSSVLLAAATVDQNIVFYDIRGQKKPVKIIQTQQPITTLAMHTDGHTMVAGGMYGGLYIYNLKQPNKYKEKLTGHDTTIKHIELFRKNQPSTTKHENMSQGSSSSRYSQRTQKDKSQKNFINQPLEIKNNNMNLQKQEKKEKEKEVKINTWVKDQLKNSREVAPIVENRNKIQNKPVIPNKARQITSDQIIPKPPKRQQPYSQTSSQMHPQPTHQSNQDYQTITSELSILRHDLSTTQQTLKHQINEMSQRFSQQMIRQFALSQRQMKRFMDQIFQKDRKKDQYIRELQEEVKKHKRGNF